MEDVTILGACGIIVAIGGAITYIAKALKPYNDMKKSISKHQTLLDNDDKRLKALEEGNKLTQKSLLALLDHEITGNSVEKLKKAKSDLQDYLIER